MDNKTKLSKIAQYQKNGKWHELTCGNDSQHLPLVGKEVNGKVILACLECDYTQEYIPEVVFEMYYKLTKKSQNSKKCKDGKNRNFILYFLNGEQIFKHKRSFDEKMEYGFDGRWFYKNTYILNNTLYQTRYDDKEERLVKFPLSKKMLLKYGIPKDYKIELSK